MKTDFYFRNLNQKFRRECAQCTKVSQYIYIILKREKKKIKIIGNKIEQK